jgi:hypothetical protein
MLMLDPMIKGRNKDAQYKVSSRLRRFSAEQRNQLGQTGLRCGPRDTRHRHATGMTAQRGEGVIETH